jgi:hypothetical protein
MKYIEEDMIAAIYDVRNEMSVRGTEKKYKVSKTTLYLILKFSEFQLLSFINRHMQNTGKMKCSTTSNPLLNIYKHIKIGNKKNLG